MNENTLLIQSILSALEKMQNLNPLIHIIPNTVSAAFVADGVAAIGARPVMAVNEAENAEITASADALAVNMGQPSEEKINAAKVSLTTAVNHHIPVVFDPVGAGASRYRKDHVHSLLSIPWTGIVKGNGAEINTVQTGILQHQGVDSLTHSPFLPVTDADRVFAVTGQEDLILTSSSKITLKHLFPKTCTIVGTGCLIGGLCGAFLSVSEPVTAACAGLAVMGYASQKTAMLSGYGSIKTGILDVLGQIDQTEFKKYLHQTISVNKHCLI